MASLFEFYMYTYVIVEFGWSIKNIKRRDMKMSVKKYIKEQIGARRFDLHLLKNYGVYSVKKNWENRRYHKCPSKELMDDLHILDEQELNKQRSVNFNKKIKFSIITPLYNTPKKFLIELIESVENQTYANWELCLADGSDKEHSYVGEFCKKKMSNDDRIQYHALEKNEGISDNTNECIKLATGNYYALLDHDDLLHPSALYEVAKVIEAKGADFIYTDEVKFRKNIYSIDNPYYFNLKPGFSKYDLRSHNYICHLTVFSKQLLESEPVFYRHEFDGSQDHDMVLRMTEKAKKIVHIPKVLYYWRIHENSVSMNLEVKSYAVDSAFRAVQAQLERSGEKGKISNTKSFQTLYRIRYEMDKFPFISIVLHGDFSDKNVKRVIEKIVEQTDYSRYEVVYCTEKPLRDVEYKGVPLIHVKIDRTIEHNNAQKWNQAISEASGEHIVLLDTDVYPTNKYWLQEMVMYSMKKDVAVVGPKILYEDDRIAYAGIALKDDYPDKLYYLCGHDSIREIGYEAMLLHVRRTGIVTSACMMFKKEIWHDLGGFDAQMLEYEDADFCLRAMNNIKGVNIWTCFAKLCSKREKLYQIKSSNAISSFVKKYQRIIEQDDIAHPEWDELGLV